MAIWRSPESNGCKDDHTISRTEGLRIAIVADAHLRFRPEDQGCQAAAVSPPEARYARFLEAADGWGADALIDLGDLHPRSFDSAPGEQITDAWDAWPTETIAVLGNHDHEFVGRDTYLERMGMPAEFYATTVAGWTFVILWSGEEAVAPGTAGDAWGWDQLPWLAEQLEDAPGRCVILVHRGTAPEEPTFAPQRIKHIIDETNRAAGYRKVVAYICGHHHTSRAIHADGVDYVLVNSTSYRWSGDLGPLYYRDPPPFGLGVLAGSTGRLHLHGTGRPDNWAIDACDGFDAHDLPADGVTYQADCRPLRR